jgi:hypothetical protein
MGIRHTFQRDEIMLEVAREVNRFNHSNMKNKD